MGLRSASIAAILAAAAMISVTGGALADRLDEIKARGELIAGVKADAPPFGFRDEAGEIIGLEIDLARAIAEKLGVGLRLFPVSASSRLQFLEQGAIDIVIATMAATEARKKAAALIEPPYYRTEIALLAPKSAAISSVSDLAGKPVCAMLGAYYNDALMSQAQGARLVLVKSPEEAVAALKEGRCAGFAQENAKLIFMMTRDPARWTGYAVTPLGIAPLSWIAAVETGEKDGRLARLVSETISEWHRTGKLAEAEKRWLGENTSWVVEMRNGTRCVNVAPPSAPC